MSGGVSGIDSGSEYPGSEVAGICAEISANSLCGVETSGAASGICNSKDSVVLVDGSVTCASLAADAAWDGNSSPTENSSISAGGSAGDEAAISNSAGAVLETDKSNSSDAVSSCAAPVPWCG